ncbi:MAG: hypothetical protein AB8B56_13585 [Crocinitomicaceae bacterium]
MFQFLSITKSFTLTFVVFCGGLLLLNSCEDSSEDSNEEVITEERDPRFLQCYFEDDLAKNRCDSVLISIFGKELFSRNIQFDKGESTLNCEVDGDIQLIAFGDSNYCIPNSYDLRYVLNSNGNSIFPFRMVAGNDMVFEPVSTIIQDQLMGYRKLLEGNFNISYTKAKSIAVMEGVDFNESYLELVMNEEDSLSTSPSYLWEAELEYDHNSVLLLLIDAMSGETRKELLTPESFREKASNNP